MPEAGFSRAACLDVDLAFEDFDIWLSAREEETVEEPAPAQSKPTIQRPKYRTLAQLIGLEDQETAKAFAVTDEEAALAEAIAAGSIDLDALLGGMPPS